MEDRIGAHVPADKMILLELDEPEPPILVTMPDGSVMNWDDVMTDTEEADYLGALDEKEAP